MMLALKVCLMLSADWVQGRSSAQPALHAAPTTDRAGGSAPIRKQQSSTALKWPVLFAAHD